MTDPSDKIQLSPEELFYQKGEAHILAVGRVPGGIDAETLRAKVLGVGKKPAAPPSLTP